MTNTTATTTDATRTEAPARRRRPLRGLTRLLALALLGLSSLVGLDVAQSDPASAATAVTFCFKHRRTNVAAGQQPVQLWQVNAAGARIGSQLRSGKTGANGCATFYNTPSNVRLRVFARASYGDANIGWTYYDGATNYLANPGRGTVNLYTGTITRTCVAGYYDNLCRVMPG